MVFRRRKQIFLIVALLNLVFLSMQVAAFELAVLNDVSEMAESKRIMLKVAFSIKEKLVYREMLRFSSSNPKIILRYWKASAAAKSEYVAPFHQPKRVFTESFGLELTFEAKGLDGAALITELTRTNVAVSYVALGELQKHNAQTAFANLAGRSIVSSSQNDALILSGAPVLEVQLAQVLSGTQQSGNEAGLVAPIVDEEIFYLKRGEAFCEQLSNLLDRMLKSWGIFFILCIFCITLVLAVVRVLLRNHLQALRYFPSKFAQLVLTLFPFACIGTVGLCGASGVAFIALGLYSLLVGCYLLLTQNDTQDFKTKSLGLLGGFLIVSALPAIIKGVLLLAAG